jgi:hypothetical protein
MANGVDAAFVELYKRRGETWRELTAASAEVLPDAALDEAVQPPSLRFEDRGTNAHRNAVQARTAAVARKVKERKLKKR